MGFNTTYTADRIGGERFYFPFWREVELVRPDMSQIAPQPTQEQAAPITDELNGSIEHPEEEETAVQKILDEYTDLPPEEQQGRPVLSYQIPQQIAEVLLTTLPLSPLYRHNRDIEVTTAWKIKGTTKAIIGYDGEDRQDGPWFMLPPAGEANLDLRWMMLQSLYREYPFEIDYLSEKTARSVLKATYPKHRRGMEQLLHESQATALKS